MLMSHSPYRRATLRAQSPAAEYSEYLGKPEGGHKHIPGILGTVPAEEHLPGHRRSQWPWSQPKGQAAQPGAAGPRRYFRLLSQSPLLVRPSLRHPRGPHRPISKAPLSPSPPSPDVFLALSPSQPSSDNHNNFSAKQKQLGRRARALTPPPCWCFLQGSRGLHLPPSHSVSGPACLGPAFAR